MVSHLVVGSAGAETLLSPALLKLIDVLEEENLVLRRHNICLHAGFTDRKNQALRELMAVQRSTGGMASQKACSPLLERLGNCLQENGRLLKLNIAAVGEISDIIIGSLRDAESDGTYSRGRISSCR
jgi:hypothetical protein